MILARTLLMILAVICLFLAAINIPSTRVNLLAAGLALWALSLLVT